MKGKVLTVDSLCNDNGLLKREFADIVGVHPTTISKWGRENRIPENMVSKVILRLNSKHKLRRRVQVIKNRTHLDELTMPTINLNIGSINTSSSNYVRMDRDSRKTQALAKTIKKHGLIHPILVQAKTKKGNMFDIICGFGRYEAVLINKGKSIKAQVVPWNVPIDREAINFIENMHRDEPNSFEYAQQVLAAERKGLKPLEIAERYSIGLSKVNDLIRTGKDLPKQYKNILTADLNKQGKGLIHDSVALMILNQARTLRLKATERNQFFDFAKTNKVTKGKIRNIINLVMLQDYEMQDAFDEQEAAPTGRVFISLDKSQKTKLKRICGEKSIQRSVNKLLETVLAHPELGKKGKAGMTLEEAIAVGMIE